jgi:hypothetical protein
MPGQGKLFKSDNEESGNFNHGFTPMNTDGTTTQHEHVELFDAAQLEFPVVEFLNGRDFAIEILERNVSLLKEGWRPGAVNLEDRTRAKDVETEQQNEEPGITEPAAPGSSGRYGRCFVSGHVRRMA